MIDCMGSNNAITLLSGCSRASAKRKNIILGQLYLHKILQFLLHNVESFFSLLSCFYCKKKDKIVIFILLMRLCSHTSTPGKELPYR